MYNYICFIQQNENTIDDSMFGNDVIYGDHIFNVFSLQQSVNHQRDEFFEDEDCVIVFHGQIYNFHPLLLDMNKVDEINTHTGLIKELFIQEKTQLFERLQGKFSLIIWDKHEHTLYGGNDSFGIKSLYYTTTSKGTYYATQKSSLVLLRKDNEVSKEGLQHYLSFQYVPEPLTMTKDIYMLETGHRFVKKENENIQKERYWRATFQPVQIEKQELIKEIRQVLTQSITQHAENKDRIGSFLSGGIDSAIVVSLMKEIIPQFKTFSVGFAFEGFSEIEVAKETADVLGVENISYQIKPEEYVGEIPEIIKYLEDPLADPSCIPLYFAAKLADKHVDTVLSGEGADELFGGYNIYREPRSLKIFNAIPKPAKSLLTKLAHMLPDEVKGKSFLLRGTTPLEKRYIGNAKIFEEEEKQELLKTFDPELSYQDITQPLYDEVRDYPLVHQMQYIDIHTWLRGDILLKADKMSAANNIDIRMPFLDEAVFQVAKKIPVDLKIADGTTKKILREAVRGIVPDHVLDRKKLGFPVPIRHWLKNELYDWAKELIHESETSDLIQKSEVKRLFEKHLQGKVDVSRKLWAILIFMKWHQVFIEGKEAQKKVFAKET